MQLLLNYTKEDKVNISSLAFMLEALGYKAVMTVTDLTIGELLAKAKATRSDAILLCNENTLRYCVPGESPSLDAWRGSRLNTSIPILVINKLEHIHSVPHGRWLLERDLAKLRYIKQKSLPFRFDVLEDQKHFPRVLSELSNAIAIAYDIETKTFDLTKEEETNREAGIPTNVKPTIITCASWTGIFANGLKTYVLPLVDFGVDHWDRPGQYERAIEFLQKANALPAPKIMHNGMYDATHSLVYHAPPLNWTLDTMAMHHAEYSELPKTLDFVASYHLYDYIYWKSQSESAAKNKDIREYWGYNAKDTWYTARILISQLRHSPVYAKRNYADKFPLVYPALYSTFEGLKLDLPVRARIRAKQSKINERALGRLRTCFDEPTFNPGSWQQVQKYIYTVFGAKHPKIGKSKSGTDEKNLLAVSDQHPLLRRICSQILEYRRSQKAIGTYIDFLQKNGRLLYALNPFGTETERMAASSSSFWCGTQVQNIPAYAKEYLIADEGYELCEVDNSQSEARCTAYCAQEEALIAALEDATRDFYKTLGTLFLDIPYEEVSDFFRNKVLKKIVHGTNYMMGANTFIENITVAILLIAASRLGIKIVVIAKVGKKNELTIKQFASQLLDAYHGPFPRIRKWYEEIKVEISSTGYLVSPLGHTRRFFGDIKRDHKILRGAVAHQPQNLSVTVLNRGFLRCYQEIVLPSGGEFRLKAQIHDSILAQYPEGKREIYIPKMLQAMNNPVSIHGRILKIPLDAKYGKNWADMTKWKAPK